MKIYHVISIAIVLMLAASCSSQKADIETPGTAEWLMNQFFVNPNPPDLREYLTGAMQQDMQPYGATVPLEVKTTYHPLQLDSTTSIWAVTSRYGEDTRDMYCYMTRGRKAWQIEAVVWSPAYDVLGEQVAQLRAINPLPDSLKVELASKELTIASDSALGAYLLGHQQQFDSLVNLTGKYTPLQLFRERCSDPNFAVEHDSIYTKACGLLSTLSIQELSRGREVCPAGTFFEVGNFLRNAVGFLWVPDGAKPPAMSFGKFYYIGKVTKNWYVYKNS
ncbi:MAG: hypothetical protein WAU88_01280 [Candidatus Zixiibacteriota bacterium]